jgi:hypothetical protein
VAVQYLHARNTIDDIIWQTIQNKLDNIGQTLDGRQDRLAVGRPPHSPPPPTQRTHSHTHTHTHTLPSNHIVDDRCQLIYWLGWMPCVRFGCGYSVFAWLLFSGELAHKRGGSAGGGADHAVGDFGRQRQRGLPTAEPAGWRQRAAEKSAGGGAVSVREGGRCSSTLFYLYVRCCCVSALGVLVMEVLGEGVLPKRKSSCTLACSPPPLLSLQSILPDRG